MDLFFDKEFRTLIPPLQLNERQNLEQSLINEGNRDPIVIWEEKNIVIDGHNRYDICITNNIPLKEPLKLSFIDRDDVKIWIIKNQMGRRNLNDYQRSVMALIIEPLLAAKAKEKQLSTLKQNQDTVVPTLAQRNDYQPSRCKTEDCKYFNRNVPRELWVVGDGIWTCPECGYGLLPFNNGQPNDYQLTKKALELEPLLTTANRERIAHDREQENKTRGQVAAVARVSHGTLDKVKVIEQKATPEQKASLVNGTASINRVYNKLKGDSTLIVPTPPIINSKPKNITIIQGDMLDVVPTLGKYDLIIADPPYNVTDFEWDKKGNNFLGITKQWLTVCKNALNDNYHLFWFCSPSYAADIEMIFRELKIPIKSRIVWHRRNMAMGSQSKERFIDTWEMIFHSGTYNLCMSDKWDDSRFDVQTFAVPQTNFNDKKLHPTQKPIELIKWLVRNGATDGSNILDPFSGSGTTGATCLPSQKCTLIDSDAGYIDIARQRLGI